MANQEEQKKPSWLGEGIILGALTVSAYAVAFMYHVGGASHFGIPWQVIEITLTDTLIALGGVFGAALPLLMLGNILPMVLRPPFSPLQRALLHFVPLTMVGLVMALHLGITALETILIGGFVGLMAIINVVLVLVADSKGKGFLGKLESMQETDDSVDSGLDILTRAHGPWIALALFGICSITLVAYTAGKGSTMRRTEFYLLNKGQQELVMLEAYGKRCIFAPLDREAKTYRREFTIKSMDSLGSPLVVAKVGPLEPAQEAKDTAKGPNAKSP
ncbi:hypothetical protein ACFL6C_14335 [Myxococcota bacterium]